MKKIWFILFLALSLTLAACSEESEQPENETASDTTEEENNELAELEKENEELKRKKLEEENAALKKELEEDKEDDNKSEEESSNGEPESAEETEEQSSSKETEKKESSPDKSAVLFDLNSEEVQSQLFGTTTGNEDGTFAQDAITNGMTQTEVEEKYGPYDFTFYAGGASPAFHGNLAVVYSQRTPYGPGNDGSDSSINPDENYVEYVWYFAHATEDELLAAWGEPDDSNAGDRTMNGLPHYIYDGYGEDGRYYTTGASTFNSPEGERVGLIKRTILDEDPQAASETINEDDIPVTEAPNPNAEIKDETDYEYLLTEYLQRLATHYNYDNYDDIYYYLKKGSTAYDKIAANKVSGDFTGHKTHSVELVSMKDLGDGTVELNANRVYSHDNSNGQQTANVTYIVNAETHEILDFK